MGVSQEFYMPPLVVLGDTAAIRELDSYKGVQHQIERQKDLISHNEAWLLDSVWIRPEEYHDPQDCQLKALKVVSGGSDFDTFFREIGNQPIDSDRDNPQEAIQSKVPETYNQRDLVIVYAQAFLAVVNNYGLSMINWLYLMHIGLDPKYAGLVHAVTPATSFLYGFFINWATKSRHFFLPFVIAQLFFMVAVISCTS